MYGKDVMEHQAAEAIVAEIEGVLKGAEGLLAACDFDVRRLVEAKLRRKYGLDAQLRDRALASQLTQLPQGPSVAFPGPPPHYGSSPLTNALGSIFGLR